MSKTKSGPVILNKITLFAISSALLCHKVEVACFDVKDASATRSHTKLSMATEPCQVRDCEITCSEMGWSWYSLIMAYSQNTMALCQTNGVNLTLPSHRDVPGTNFTWEWFPYNINFDFKIIGLQMDLEYTSYIGEQPFALGVFARVKYLRLNNLHTNELPKWTFNGLSSLEELILTNATIRSHSKGILEYFKDKLKSFSLLERNEGNSISISSFIGQNSANLTKLEYVKIKYNLDVIDYTSLTAIPFVTVLDLSECCIQAIREHSFDTLGSNLQLLNLERNKLTTLPTDLFFTLQLTSAIHGRNVHLKIALLENPWHCDYSLVYVKELLLNYATSFDEDILCASPEDQNGTQITHAELCTICTTTGTTEIGTTSTEITTTETTTTETTTTETTSTENTSTENTSTIDKNDENVELPTKQCHGSHNKTSFSPQTHEMQMSLRSGKMFVILKDDRSDMALISFGSEIVSNDSPIIYQQSEIIDCATNLSSAIVLNNLKEGVTYTFCLINRVDMAEYMAVWMYESSKSLIVSVISASLIVTIVAGVVIGIFLMRYGKNIPFDFRISFGHTKMISTEDTVDETVGSSSDLQTTTISEINVVSTGFESDSDSPPPLPPHPIWKNIGEEYEATDYKEECENYYSVVK